MENVSIPIFKNILEAQTKHPWELGKVFHSSFHKRKSINGFAYRSTKEYLFKNIMFGLSDCWYWIGPIDPAGYGLWCYKTKPRKAHRISYALFNGDFERTKKILHKCDSRNCVNPEHLFIGTQLDNVRDMISKGRHKFPERKYGEDNPLSKLTNKKIEEAKNLRNAGLSYKKIGKEMGFSTMAIFRVLTERSWKNANK